MTRDIQQDDCKIRDEPDYGEYTILLVLGNPEFQSVCDENSFQKDCQSDLIFY